VPGLRYRQSPKKIAVTVTVAPSLAHLRAAAEAEAEATIAMEIADKYIPRSLMSHPPCLQPTWWQMIFYYICNTAGIYQNDKHILPSMMYNPWG
jgi:hypothetical protein